MNQQGCGRCCTRILPGARTKARIRWRGAGGSCRCCCGTQDFASTRGTLGQGWFWAFDWPGCLKRNQRNSLGGIPRNNQTNSGEHVKVDKEFPRSEERRVGKECRSRWSPY